MWIKLSLVVCLAVAALSDAAEAQQQSHIPKIGFLVTRTIENLY